MTMITPSYLGETIEYSSLHACRSTLEDPTQEPFPVNLAGDLLSSIHDRPQRERAELVLALAVLPTAPVRGVENHRVLRAETLNGGGTGLRIDVVLFDLGGTVVDTRDFQGWSMDARSLGLEIDPEDIALAWESIRPWVVLPDTSPERRWRDVLSRAAKSDVPEADVARFLEVQREKPIPGALFSDARRCLEILEQAEKRLGIVSNSRSESSVRQLMAKLDIERAFDVVVSSGTEGIRKPNPEIFHRALARLNASAREALFVGDDIENDFDGAVRAGLHAVWLNRAGTGMENERPQILSLSEVPRVVRLLEACAPVK